MVNTNIYIFFAAGIVILNPGAVSSILSVLFNQVSAKVLTMYVLYTSYWIVLSIGSLTLFSLTFEICDQIIVYYKCVSLDPNMFDAAPLAVERLPSDKITGLPHTDRMMNNPWATTGAVIVGMIVVSKIIIQFFF